MGNTAEKALKGGSFLVDDLDPSQLFVTEDLTEEQKMIAKTTEDYIKKEVRPHIDTLENQDLELTKKLLKKAGDLGLLGADVPEAYGGIGLDKISSSLITEKFAAARSFSLSYGAHVGIGSLPIVLFGNEEQKKKYLPSLATGEKFAAYALTEPGSGSDALGARTTARLNEEGTHYILNGEKQWITNSGFADVFVVYAKIDGEQFSAFIVEKEFPGVSTGAEEKKMGIKASSTRTLILDNVPVPKENLLYEPGRGHVIAFNILNIGRYKLAVGCVGGAKLGVEIAVKYAKERQQFKQPIANFTLIQNKLANMAIKTFASESSVYRTVGLFADRLDALTEEEAKDGSKIAGAIAEYAMECSLNKVFASETLDFIADEAVQIHGGYGYMHEYEVETMYRDSRINRIFEGTNEINRLLVPSTILRKTMKGELPLLQKAQTLQEELMMLMPEEPGTDVLDKEKYLLKNAKKIFLMVAGLGVQKFGKALDKEQELLSNVADIVNGIYTMESVMVRTEKGILKDGEAAHQQKILMTEVYCQETFEVIERLAKESLLMIEEGDTLRIMLSALKKLARFTPDNVIAKKRQIAAALIEAETFIV
ncbi:acyl-CoA dehydrogenase family protein [Pullulanibacillus sp. KACC 23026]|uniref:acyl-CoA dehydrogenase family protein n=1 Tax=Pullulanibacillus sp. KACC 23026 TaxID=3028315 RepID=UPI0023B0BF0E|nr:acyl-CoA dehydrogenase family protein [Pullulanibacillus sp. KACC 23026]WEG13754.1 acyl-CoA dehydrogenase family protein [Pullulanibacillus sp. KACC 23026]